MFILSPALHFFIFSIFYIHKEINSIYSSFNPLNNDLVFSIANMFKLVFFVLTLFIILNIFFNIFKIILLHRIFITSSNDYKKILVFFILWIFLSCLSLFFYLKDGLYVIIFSLAYGFCITICIKISIHSLHMHNIDKRYSNFIKFIPISFLEQDVCFFWRNNRIGIVSIEGMTDRGMLDKIMINNRIIDYIMIDNKMVDYSTVQKFEHIFRKEIPFFNNEELDTVLMYCH